jgi:hypothetical protein
VKRRRLPKRGYVAPCPKCGRMVVHGRSTGAPGCVPLKVTDKTAQDLLWEYAQRRRAVDAEFADDLETALRSKGFDPDKPNGMEWEMAVTSAERAAKWALVLVGDIAGWSGSSGNWPLQSASGLIRRVTDGFARWRKGDDTWSAP